MQRDRESKRERERAQANAEWANGGKRDNEIDVRQKEMCHYICA